MPYVPDNYDAFCQHEAEQEAELDKLPKCCDCKERIQTENCYVFDDDIYCLECLEEHRKCVEDLID